MGKISKGVKCSVTGCDKPAVRSISQDKAQAAELNIETERRVYVCSDHWKEIKKKLKKEKRIEKWRWANT
jgi:uncharacterized pyridoxamine 5'-phosphate oxidase family protein